MVIWSEESLLQLQTPSSQRKSHGHLQFFSTPAGRTVKTQAAPKATYGYEEEAQQNGKSLFLFLKSQQRCNI